MKSFLSTLYFGLLLTFLALPNAFVDARINTPDSERNLIQEQAWARDDEGQILWWIWLIIAICGFICCFVCCWSSACCLRD